MPADRTDHTHKTEELLQSYARVRRRDQAGPPFVLHPATRNLLQGEVVRTYRSPQGSERKASLTFLPRFILGGAVLALLLLGAGLWLRYDHEQELASSRALTNSLMLFSQSPPPGLRPPPQVQDPRPSGFADLSSQSAAGACRC